MASVLLESLSEGIATLTMNRPESLNALSGEMMENLLEALPRLAKDPNVGAVVITGAGRAFCAGGDVKAMAEGTEFKAETLEAKAQALSASMDVSRWLHQMATAVLCGGRSPATTHPMRMHRHDSSVVWAYTRASDSAQTLEAA